LASESGGMSGAPARQRNTQIVRDVVQRTNGRLTVVASGGIMSSEGAQEKLDAGATLVQLYTGLIYKGPGLVKEIVESYRG
jgi:dihydroorotate dehydrogenase